VPALFACGSQGDSEARATSPDMPPAASPSQAVLPPDHPVIPPNHPDPTQGVVPPPQAGSGVGDQAITWQAPEDWVEEPPSTSMRRAQWRIPGDEDQPDAECAVFYFGPGQGGDALSNAHRWASQFTLEDGRAGTEGALVYEQSTNGLPVTIVEVAGTYNPGMPFAARATESRPDHLLLGAIVEGPDANWFLKCTGPAPTLLPRKPGFEMLLSSLRRGTSLTSAS
jgi:hypothetical protein